MATSKKRTLALKLALWQCLGIATLWMLGACTLPYVATTAVASQPSQSLASLELIAAGLNQPVGLANARDGSGRIFVIEKQGVVRVIEDGQLAAAPFLDITPRVGSTNSEQGLLGLAFAPDFPASRRFYVNYTDMDGNTVISRFTVAEDGAADPSSEEILLQIVQPARNHNGGHLAFGPDGMLWIGTGDGGGDNGPNAQNPTNLLGKMLRIDPRASGARPYSVPKDNPLLATKGAKPEIWSLGLRNPWRYSFDDDGNLWVADVGQNKWEEVSVAPAKRDGAGAITAGGRGTNFGWPAYEGPERYKTDQQARNALRPIHSYQHGDEGCSISGGARVSRDHPQIALRGWYLYSDYCSGTLVGLELNGLKLVSTHDLVDGLGNAVSVDQTSTGIYVSSLDDKVYEIIAS